MGFKVWRSRLRSWWPLLLCGLLWVVLGCATSIGTSVPLSPTPTSSPSRQPAVLLTTRGPSPEDIQEQALLYKLLDFRGDSREVIKQMGESGDTTFIFPLVELLQFFVAPQETLDALHKLTGQKVGTHGFDWVEWLGQQEGLEPPYGYAGWKGAMLSELLGVDYSQFLYDGVKTNIRLDEIVWGGTGIDGIPDLFEPAFISADEATYLSYTDRVFGVSVNGDHRAYPLRIMDSHEMANDVVGGKPVALSYCTLCGSGILYEREIEELGGVTSFGTSGLLYRNNKLMYDRKTKTLWRQFTGEPAVGPLADSGIRLKMLPLTLTTWKAWRKEHPDTKVLDINNTGYAMDYTPGAAYGDYFATGDVMFPLTHKDTRLGKKEWVLGVDINGATKAYPLSALQSDLVVNDTVGSQEIVVVMEPVSGSVRAYTRRNRTFQPSEELLRAKETATSRDVWGFTSAPGSEVLPDIQLIDHSGNVWRATDEVLVNVMDSNQQLKRVSTSHVTYWFGWISFHPKTELYRRE